MRDKPSPTLKVASGNAQPREKDCVWFGTNHGLVPTARHCSSKFEQLKSWLKSWRGEWVQCPWKVKCHASCESRGGLLLNVPLMWTAAGHEASARVQFPATSVQRWKFGDPGSRKIGVELLRAAIRTWGSAQPEDLTIWLRNNVFPGPQVGSHISARAQEYVLSERCRHDARVGLFALVPMMLLHRVQVTGRVGGDELAARGDLFTRGRWRELIDEALRVEVSTPGIREVLTEDQRRERAAQDRVQRQVSRPRQELVGSLLAPKTAETLTEFRSHRPQVLLREIPQEVMQFEPKSPLHLDLKIFSVWLRSAQSGSAPGPGGRTNEMLKVCLDDEETLQLLGLVAADFARATSPRSVTAHTLLTDDPAQEEDLFAKIPRMS